MLWILDAMDAMADSRTGQLDRRWRRVPAEFGFSVERLCLCTGPYRGSTTLAWTCSMGRGPSYFKGR